MCFRFPSNNVQPNQKEHRPHGQTRELSVLPRTESTSEFMPLEEKEVEYFFASDASAVIEHTNRVIYLEVMALRMYIYVCIRKHCNFCVSG